VDKILILVTNNNPVTYILLPVWCLILILVVTRVTIHPGFPRHVLFFGPVGASAAGFPKIGVDYIRVLHIGTCRSQQVAKS